MENIEHGGAPMGHAGRVMLSPWWHPVQLGSAPHKAHWPCEPRIFKWLSSLCLRVWNSTQCCVKQGALAGWTWCYPSLVFLLFGVSFDGIHFFPFFIAVPRGFLPATKHQRRWWVGAHFQCKCKAWCHSWRSLWHWAAGAWTMLWLPPALTKPWWGSAGDRGSWCEVQKCVLLVCYRRHLGQYACPHQVEGRDVGWHLTVVRGCLGSFHSLGGIWHRTALMVWQAWLGS